MITRRFVMLVVRLVCLVVLLIVPAGVARPAPTRAISQQRPAGRADDSEEVGFQVSAFSAWADETWGWSVTNQSNNSGWMKVNGGASWTAIMRVPRSRKPVLTIFPMPNGYIVNLPLIPVAGRYKVDWVSKTEQHPPTSCHDAGPWPSAGSSLALGFDAAPSNPRHPDLIHEAITITWPDLSEVSTGQKCSPEGFNAPDTWFKKVEMVADLEKGEQVTLQASGRIPVPVTSTEDCYGCIGFKGDGDYTWHAEMTLIRLVHLAPLAGQ